MRLAVNRGTVIVTRSWVFLFAAAILVFNLIDSIMTLAVVTLGAAEEANPFMEITLQWGPAFFVVAKLALVSAGVGLLWLRRDRVLAKVAMVGLSAVYGGIVCYHMHSLEAVMRALP